MCRLSIRIKLPAPENELELTANKKKPMQGIGISYFRWRILHPVSLNSNRLGMKKLDFMPLFNEIKPDLSSISYNSRYLSIIVIFLLDMGALLY